MIGQRLESARKERGLSRQALGTLSGLTGQTVANIEVKGMIPRVDTAEMLARVLGVTAGWLGFGIGPHTSHVLTSPSLK
jgi:transcriptional regulator with XRE-family HTH domain